MKTQKTWRQSPHDCGCLPANKLQTLPLMLYRFTVLRNAHRVCEVHCLNCSCLTLSLMPKPFALSHSSGFEFLFKVLKDTSLLIRLFGLLDQNVVLRSEMVKCSLGGSHAERCASVSSSVSTWKQGWSLLILMFPDWVMRPWSVLNLLHRDSPSNLMETKHHHLKELSTF